MRVILIPGLGGHVSALDSLRRKLEQDGHECKGPGFTTNTLLNGELEKLTATLDRSGPAAVVGHSAGGLLAVLAAQAGHPNVKVVIGLGTPLVGVIKLAIPYYEAGSWLRFFSPLFGPQIERFLLPHWALPFAPCVQTWVAERLKI